MIIIISKRRFQLFVRQVPRLHIIEMPIPLLTNSQRTLCWHEGPNVRSFPPFTLWFPSHLLTSDDWRLPFLLLLLDHSLFCPCLNTYLTSGIRLWKLSFMKPTQGHTSYHASPEQIVKPSLAHLSRSIQLFRTLYSQHSKHNTGLKRVSSSKSWTLIPQTFCAHAEAVIIKWRHIILPTDVRCDLKNSEWSVNAEESPWLGTTLGPWLTCSQPPHKTDAPWSLVLFDHVYRQAPLQNIERWDL